MAGYVVLDSPYVIDVFFSLVHMESKTIIYVVDDEPDALDLMSRSLSNTYDVRGFTAPLEALSAAKKDLPECVVADFRMPEMNGVQLIRALRDAGIECAALMVTAFSDEDEVLAAEQENLLFHVISKPWKPRDLLMYVNLAISTFRTQR